MKDINEPESMVPITLHENGHQQNYLTIIFAIWPFNLLRSALINSGQKRKKLPMGLIGLHTKSAKSEHVHNSHFCVHSHLSY